MTEKTICKYCDSKNTTYLIAEGGLGGGTLKMRYYDKDIPREHNFEIVLCLNCGRLTPDKEEEQ